MRFVFSVIRSIAPLMIAAVVGCTQSPEPPTRAEVGSGQRIISLAPHLTELAFAAGAGQRLVGVVEYSNYPVEAMKLPRIGDAFRVDYEAIALLRPDLILAWRSGTPKEITQRLRSLGYRVVELDAGRLEDIAGQLLTIGRLAGTETSAAAAATEISEAIALLRVRYHDRQRVSAFMQIAAEPLYTVTGAHVISDIITTCGGRNVFAELAGIAPSVSVEAVVAANPDVIMATGESGDTRWMLRWQRLTGMQAVQRGQLYTIDRNLISRSGPRLIAGAIQVCAALDSARADAASAVAAAG